MKNKLPDLETFQQDANTTLREQDEKAKHKMKLDYWDSINNAKKSDLKIGDTVLVRQQKQDKLSSYFDPVPYKITQKKGTMVTAKRGDRTITRNTSFFKKVNSAPIADNYQDDQSEDEDDFQPERLPQQQPMQQQTRHVTPAIDNQQTVHRPQRQRQLPRRLNDFIID